jgi:autophagy-related protein 2
MTSWFSTLTSGFPTLPSLPSLSSFALPSGIQRRFISFVLRRALGKFVKPGQLDEEKIDSQIGSGYVRVANLELDHDVSPLSFSVEPLY